MPLPRDNLTGFDVKKYVNSTGTPAKDPWSRAEVWRYTGPFTRANRFKGAFPGFGIALVAFTAYSGYEYLFMKDEHHAKEGHEEQHH
ncbi:hypothetical protein MMC09_003092 [Bachmanniomyces sp. S44760]|nr:hypothetical protein [Bachmanniomyces sp. S44760]